MNPLSNNRATYLANAIWRPVRHSGIVRVIIFASILIVFSMTLIGLLVYRMTEEEVVKKLKTHDLMAIAQSLSVKVDARIDRAVETSLVLAQDPDVLEWVTGLEQDPRLQTAILQRMKQLANWFGYSHAFIVSALTFHYWNDTGHIIDTLSTNDPEDDWFFKTIRSRQAASVNFDYNPELGGTFAFVNALSGNTESPSAVVGVGMSLHELSDEFAAYKQGTSINLWLVDKDGTVFLSDHYADNGKNINLILPQTVAQKLQDRYDLGTHVMDYRNHDGQLRDLISYKLTSTDLHLLVAVERNETVAFLRTIKWNTILTVIISLISILFFFLYISRKLANPYKQAVALNQELEEQVAQRTKELTERNVAILDSISYAKLLQESVLPSDQQLQATLADHFVIWRPRDVVGGDFYWMKQVNGKLLVAVGDCTGHGVPGAFMTLLAVSTLNRIVANVTAVDPALILGELNRLLKQTLRQDVAEGITDDGLDIGLCVIEVNEAGEGSVRFAGAETSLYRADPASGIEMWKGDRRSVGYRRTPLDYTFTNHEMPLGSASFYLTTDGFYDQNGGDKDYSYGKKRFAELIANYRQLPLHLQKEAFIHELTAYMGNEQQRDDITVLAFKPGRPTAGSSESGGISDHEDKKETQPRV